MEEVELLGKTISTRNGDVKVTKIFIKPTPEELFAYGIERLSVAAHVRRAVKGLGREEAVLMPDKLASPIATRVAVSSINKVYKEMYKQEGFSDRLRKYGVHTDKNGLFIVRIV